MQFIPVILCVLAIISPILCEPRPELQRYPDRVSMSGDDVANMFSNEGLRPSKRWLKIPSVSDLIDYTKEVLSGTPARIVMRLINKICSSGVVVRGYVPKKSAIKLHLMTPGFKDPISLQAAMDILEYPEFQLQSHKNLTIVITGWKTNANDLNDALFALHKAYSCRDTHNLIIIDTGRFIENLYTWTTLDTETVGGWVGDAIAELSEKIPFWHFHLLGHSLGAHIAGAAARRFQELTGEQIPRVTGLDPALPCFDKSKGLVGLQRGDAAYVDIIHTNNGVLGNRDPIGDVDFYPNGPTSLQPGCSDVICAHNRALKYYAESVVPGLEESFSAVRCKSMELLQANKCHGQVVSMGFALPRNVKGNYILEVNSKAPYGKNVTANQDVKCQIW